MARDSMRGELVLATLLYIKRRTLVKEKRFAPQDYFIDECGNPLPPHASSLPDVAKRNIFGAVIEALVKLGLDENASDASIDYFEFCTSLGNLFDPI